MKLIRPSVIKLFLFLITLSVIAACELETTVPKKINPDDRQYEGTWIGNTSQTKLLTFDVVNSSNGPIISSCLLEYLDHPDYKRRKLINLSGLSEIRAGHFDSPDASPQVFRRELNNSQTRWAKASRLFITTPMNTITFTLLQHVRETRNGANWR